MLFPWLLFLLKPKLKKQAEESAKNTVKKTITELKVKESTAEITCLDGFVCYKIIRSKIVFVGKTSEFVVLSPELLIDAEMDKHGGIYINEGLFISKQSIARWEIKESSTQTPKATDFLIH